jgi:hypothetical protein
MLLSRLMCMLYRSKLIQLCANRKLHKTVSSWQFMHVHAFTLPGEGGKCRRLPHLARAAHCGAWSQVAARHAYFNTECGDVVHLQHQSATDSASSCQHPCLQYELQTNRLWQRTVYLVLTPLLRGCRHQSGTRAASLQGVVSSPAPLTLSDAKAMLLASTMPPPKKAPPWQSSSSNQARQEHVSVNSEHIQKQPQLLTC